jgi:hypothetical protein
MLSDRALIVNLEDGTEDTIAHSLIGSGGLRGVQWLGGDSYLVLTALDVLVTHNKFTTVSSLSATLPNVRASANTFSQSGDEVLIGCTNNTDSRSIAILALVESSTQFKNITIDGLLSNDKIQNFVKVI